MSAYPERIYRRQKVILQVLYPLFRVLAVFRRRRDWLIGPEEIAGMVRNLSLALPSSRTAVFKANAFYTTRYDVVIHDPNSRFELWRRVYGGPVVLAWLASVSRGVIYVGGGGFLEAHHDERAFEFAYLAGHGKRIVCLFTGNDIRSPRLMQDLAARTGQPNIGTALAQMDPLFADPAYDDARRERAAVAERYAQAIFTARIDQLSYFTGPTHPFPYFYPDDQFLAETTKYDRLDTVRIVHAPSNPLLKGTDAVREAMRRLTLERDDFQYRELTGVSNAEVLEALTDAHIVVNEFLAYVPGVLGVEAMARRCVLVTSADPAVETDLGADAAQAWVVTPVDRIFENVRSLLDARSSLRTQAERGWEWARAHASASACRAQVGELLANVLAERP